MPRTVDHAERRAVIGDALIALASREGLAAVTMRAVATEAGVSLRLVQYYFDTKAGLMVGALEQLERRSNDRWDARLASASRPPDARTLIEALLFEALPHDEESRAFHALFAEYAVLSLHDEELRRAPFMEGTRRLEARITTALRGAGFAPRDARIEAVRLLALANGLGNAVLLGQASVRTARAAARAHVRDLFD